MIIKYLGQSCFYIEMGGSKLLFDPFISGNEMAKHIDIDAIEADYILLTHGHQDHVLDAERIAKNTGAKIISNFEIVSWYNAKDIDGHPMNLGGKWEFDFGTVKYVNAVHSSVLPDGTPGGNPGGFVIYNDDVCFYHAGDTALTFDMQLIPMTCPALDFAILPIGDNFTMGYQEASLASDFIDCDEIYGCHFDTFGYIRIDHSEAIEYFSERNKKLTLLDIGEEREIN